MEKRDARTPESMQPLGPPPGLSEAEEFTPPPLRSRHVYLRPITPNDYGFLQMLETAGEPAARWRHRGVTPSPEQWAQTLWNGVLVQFLVIGLTDNTPVGRVMIYQPNFQDQSAYFAALRFEPRERSPVMILGISLFLQYVFTYWEFEKLYMEVPEYNFSQIASGLGTFFAIEGRLRGHFKMGGRSWDQLILAVYRQQAIEHGERLRLDYGRRSTFVSESSIRSAGEDVGSNAEGQDAGVAEAHPPIKRRIRWEDFAVEVARIADVPPEQIHDGSRVLEDLALDSLALAELGVVLVDKYDVWSLSKELGTRSWADVTVRELFDEYLTGVPVKKPPAAGNPPRL